ncbi:MULTISPECIES: hypothetical protein [Bacillus cereus group]|uniref:hypothetical protein n=1 Tax=Bacillus TaxID=1386 RepID=UPI000BEDDBD8|nr:MULTISPECIES: hypothetical protein [Bacillus cereus group]PEF24960.1 hypothetical protein CON69_10410 [Bacillus pseudomycoides]PGD77077.1 hypothetical protein COM46_08555 [Bacillus pseudomycoides]WCT65423.1 hypothetical protein PRK74_06335 [Bacillus cereus]
MKIRIKKGKKYSAMLLAASLIALIVSDIIENLYISAAAVIFGMAVLAAEVTEIFLNWKKRKRNDE